MNIGGKQKRVRREEAPAGADMGTREERLFWKWLSGAERSLGRLARSMSRTWDIPPEWFRDKLAARMFGRMIGERLCRKGGGSPVPYGDVRNAALSAGMDVTDHRFASELLKDLLVVSLENGRYVVQDLGERGCYCAPYNSNASWEAGIPRTLRLPPGDLLRFLGEFDRRLPMIHAAADGLEREVRASLRADEVLMASVRAVAAGRGTSGTGAWKNDMKIPLGVSWNASSPVHVSDMKLNELTRESIASGPVPMDDLLRDSLYYPASRTDGRPVKLCNTVWRRLGIDSFVYCDFDLSVGEFLADTRTMHGYHMLGSRRLAPAEYIPEGWTIEMVPEGDGRRRYWDSFLGHGGPAHGACWVVMERDADMSPVHGPERLSILYVCGEGLATFQQLYCSRGIAPKMLCFIQCWGFAGNWTDFSACGAPFHRTLLKYRECTPEWLCFGDCCGIHGAVRLRRLGYAGVRCLGYRTRRGLERMAGESLPGLEGCPEGGMLTYSKAGRRFLAVSVSHHMEYAVYDITRSRLDLPVLLDWLLLIDPGRGCHESYLTAWAGIRVFDAVGVPVLDEKLEWRFLDPSPSVARAVAIVRSVKAVYDGTGVPACPPLVTDALKWALDNIDPAGRVRVPDGLSRRELARAKIDGRELLRELSLLRTDVHANVGFGRG